MLTTCKVEAISVNMARTGFNSLLNDKRPLWLIQYISISVSPNTVHNTVPTARFATIIWKHHTALGYAGISLELADKYVKFMLN